MSSTARLSSSPAPTFSTARDALDEERVAGRAYCTALTAAVDDWLGQIYAAATEGRALSSALLAVGGYGRSELCPRSDIDVVLVHRGATRDVAAVADGLWYPIWDDGVHLDYSVRTVDEMVEMASRDVKVALGLLSARLIAGDDELAAGVIGRVRRQWAAKPQHSLSRLRSEVESRWAEYGDLAFTLEPDLKRARGGLRDTDALDAAIAAAQWDFTAPARRPADTLLAMRVALHQVTGRRTDQLTLDEQERVAAHLGYRDADELMAIAAAAGRHITWVTEDAMRRIAARPTRTGSRREIASDIVLLDGEVALTANAEPRGDSSLALRVAVASAEHDAPIARGCLETLAIDAPEPEAPWPTVTLNALVALLGTGAVAIGAIETLDHIGVLERYLPEWSAVRSRPQRNAYHRFTVDRHLCEAAAEAAALVRDVHRPDLLLVAALLHDIGKGSEGDHTVAGERLVEDIALRMGFGPADVDELVRLVRHHLLLADVASRRDLDDPATIAAVAERVGTLESLALLSALTVADSKATGPAAWSEWKAGLIDTLVERTAAVLRGEPQPAERPEFTAQEFELMAERRVRVVPGEGSVTVVAPDRPGLLSFVAGTFSVHKLEIRGAVAGHDGDMACDVFTIEGDPHRPPDWARIETDLLAAIGGELDIEGVLARREAGGRPIRRAGAARPARPRVLIDNTSTPAATIVEVRTPDGTGVLYRITSAIAVIGFDIASAKVLTLGHEVVDTFYVVEAGTRRRSTNPAKLRHLEDAILSALRRPW